MFVNLVIFCAVVAVGSAITKTPQDSLPVPLTLYYESLCPYSVRFIVNHLHPVKSSPLGRYVDVTLIPYGKAASTTVGTDVTFVCQHGPKECYGNKVQACAIKYIEVDSNQNTKTKESLTLDYVNCLMDTWMNNKEAAYPGAKCANELQLSNWNVIEKCANSTEGSNLLREYGVRTLSLNPLLTGVPTVTFNNKMDKELQELATTDLKKAVCHVLEDSKLSECGGDTNDAIANISTFATVLACFAVFVITQLF